MGKLLRGLDPLESLLESAPRHLSKFTESAKNPHAPRHSSVRFAKTEIIERATNLEITNPRSLERATSPRSYKIYIMAPDRACG